MRTVKLSAFLSGLCGVAVALGLLAVSAHADVTTERGASILAFPKVLANGDADTLIQIANTSNSMVHARCFYVNAAPNPFTGAPLWQVTDFTIWLTKQQPTHWQVSTGRFVDPTDQCIVNGQIQPWLCANAGIDPGAVPPVPDNFEGELKCVEVDVSDSPIGGNHLKGEATIKIGEDVSKYNAIGIRGYRSRRPDRQSVAPRPAVWRARSGRPVQCLPERTPFEPHHRRFDRSRHSRCRHGRPLLGRLCSVRRGCGLRRFGWNMHERAAHPR